MSRWCGRYCRRVTTFDHRGGGSPIWKRGGPAENPLTAGPLFSSWLFQTSIHVTPNPAKLDGSLKQHCSCQLLTAIDEINASIFGEPRHPAEAVRDLPIIAGDSQLVRSAPTSFVAHPVLECARHN